MKIKLGQGGCKFTYLCKLTDENNVSLSLTEERRAGSVFWKISGYWHWGMENWEWGIPMDESSPFASAWLLVQETYQIIYYPGQCKVVPKPMQSRETRKYEPREDFRINEKNCMVWQSVDGYPSGLWTLIIRFPKIVSLWENGPSCP